MEKFENINTSEDALETLLQGNNDDVLKNEILQHLNLTDDDLKNELSEIQKGIKQLDEKAEISLQILKM